jgi:DUF2934 family protein
MAKREKKQRLAVGQEEEVAFIKKPAVPSSRNVDDSRIRERAYELYLQRGDSPGDETEDWVRAEREFQQSTDATDSESTEDSSDRP